MHDQIMAVLQRHHTRHGFSGICLVRRGDAGVSHQAFGLAHHGLRVPNTITKRFDTAPVTKIFTAAAIMPLGDNGVISLETSVMPFLGSEGDTDQ